MPPAPDETLPASEVQAAATAAASLEGGIRPYQIFILTLSVFALAVLGVEAAAPLSAGNREVLLYVDTFVCALFFLDFLITLAKSENRWGYFWRWGWIDLISSIPAVSVLRMGRTVRIVRILRVLRGVRATRLISQTLLERRAQAAPFIAALVALVVVSFSSVAVLHFESDTPHANIQSAEDALWWSLATVATVGYGDKYPVTSEGRLVGIVLMMAGVGMFATLSGTLAAWFLGPRAMHRDQEVDAIKMELKTIRELLEELRRRG